MPRRFQLVFLAFASICTSLSAQPITPFPQCPAAGADTSCGVLIVYGADGSVNVYKDPSQGPYDGFDDTLVGIRNDSSGTIFKIDLTGSGIFGFDGDGVCAAYNPVVPGISCPFTPGGTGYEGTIHDFAGFRRGVSFSNFDSGGNSGTVNFLGGIPPNGTAWFALEGMDITVVACSSSTAVPVDLTPALANESCSKATAGTAVTINWGPFGTSTLLQTTSGERLQLRCDTLNPADATPSYSYILYYTPAAGTERPVGMNTWPRGCNSGQILAVPVAPNGSQARCLVSTVFTSKDYNQKTPNASLLFQTLIPDQAKLDWLLTTFLANVGSVTKAVELFDYDPRFHPFNPTNPTFPTCTDVGEASSSNSSTPVQKIDPPLGPITDLFFHSIGSFLSTLPPGISQMSQFSAADLNHDGKKDMADFAIFQNAFGTCAGGIRFNGNADMDGDGCVTFKDYQIFLQLYK